ncbi:serine/threonine protein kinase [Stieleria sp. ICT_E10.1]|uniref:serine/threonine-protein kinase n=1 Tax=Stieleria sedimenti TaxID=2976331 RepID=UPI002180576E|nr:serine/threonine-protein kinase [Stieleria sedimenti]MCS7468810.1 serine/threonine protein kinase [Stieleria sedimenti]
MTDEVTFATAGLKVTQERLRAFAKGQLDEAAECEVMALLETYPELAAQVAAISVDSVIAKMRSHRQVVSDQSLSSQLSCQTPDETELLAPPKEDAAEIPGELSALSDFKILREIGRGGMGVVYLAENVLTGRKEVLKVLNERLNSNSEARKRFDQEIRCIASMNHESIVRCYTVKQLGDAVVLCMEYVPGKNLHQLIANNGPLPVSFSCGVAIKICLGLQHAMNNGLIHRDIKPSNIMIHKADGKIKAKILDFGLARLNVGGRGQKQEPDSVLTDDGTLLGTLEYIAPEQCLDAASADIRSDIYSLGCSLYHMLAGHPPFSGSTGELVLAHSQASPPAIDLVRPEVPKPLADVVAKMLAKDPDERYATPQLVAEALKPLAMKSKSTAEIPDSNLRPEESIDTAVEPRNQADTSVELKCSAEAKPEPTRNLPRRKLWVTAAVFIAGMIYLVAQLIIVTPMGTIVIRDLPSDAVVLVDGQSVSVRREGGQGTIRLKQGDRQITITLTGTTLLKTRIEIHAGDEETLDLDRKMAKAEAASPAEPIKVTRARLPDLRHKLPNQNTFANLLAGEAELLANFDTHGEKYRIDPQTGAVHFLGNDHAGEMLSLKRDDLRNFHLRMEIMIQSTHESSHWNQHFVLRARQSGSDTIGWRVMLGGNRPHSEVLHQVAPFGLMGIKVRPFRGYPSGNIGVPFFRENRLSYYQAAPQSSLTRDEFHTVEYILHGETIDGFLDGRFVFSAKDELDRANRGSIVLAKSAEASDAFREFSLLELGDDATAEEYARSMALALAQD